MKKIMFINTGYEVLFEIEDGGSIEFTYAWGEKRIAKCRYIDDYHTAIDGMCFHICQIAELCEKNGSTIKPCTEA